MPLVLILARLVILRRRNLPRRGTSAKAAGASWASLRTTVGRCGGRLEGRRRGGEIRGVGCLGGTETLPRNGRHISRSPDDGILPESSGVGSRWNEGRWGEQGLLTTGEAANSTDSTQRAMRSRSRKKQWCTQQTCSVQRGCSRQERRRMEGGVSEGLSPSGHCWTLEC